MLVALTLLLCSPAPKDTSAVVSKLLDECALSKPASIDQRIWDVRSDFILDYPMAYREGSIWRIHAAEKPRSGPMESIVSMGAAALPGLCEHLTDARATKLELGNLVTSDFFDIGPSGSSPNYARTASGLPR